MLNDLSLTDTLFWCARLNLVVSNPLITDHIVKQQYGLNIFFAPAEIEKINNFVREHGEARNVTIFFRGQLLELLRWACLFCEDQPNDGVSFHNPEIRRTFAKALLIAADLWGRRIYGNRFSLEGGVDLARLRGLGAMRGAFAETSSGIDPVHALGRGRTIFLDYFPQFYPDFKRAFAIKTGMSVADYYLCVSAMIANYLCRTPEIVARGEPYSGLFNINTFSEGISPELRPLFSRYISLNHRHLRKSVLPSGDRQDRRP